jgi:hypothetical protein
MRSSRSSPWEEPAVLQSNSRAKGHGGHVSCILGRLGPEVRTHHEKETDMRDREREERERREREDVRREERGGTGGGMGGGMGGGTGGQGGGQRVERGTPGQREDERKDDERRQRP